MSENSFKPVVHLIGLVNNNKASILLYPEYFECNFLQIENCCFRINFCDVIYISTRFSLNHNKSRFFYPKGITNLQKELQQNEKSPQLFINSIVPRNKLLFDHSIKITYIVFPSNDLFEAFRSKIQEIMNKMSHRPKSLLIFINPIGGFKKGVKIYYDKVEPLFRLSDIQTEVIVTKRKDQSKDKILDLDLSQIDGIICVGGDGMLMEIVNALLLKIRRLNGISDDHHDVNEPEIPANIRIGIIPAGSTDSVALSSTGSKDSVTAAINIITGSHIKIDMLSIYHNNQFLRYNASLMGYGFYGNIVSESESYRWMGPKRYDLLGFKSFMNMQPFSAEIRYRESPDLCGHIDDGVYCTDNCTVCKHQGNFSQTTEESPGDPNEQPEWIQLDNQSSYLAFNSFLLSCRCPRSPLGASPYAHLGNGSTDLVIVRHCSRWKFLQHIIKTAKSQDHLAFDFIHTVRASEFQIKILDNSNQNAFGDDEDEASSSPILNKLRKSFSTIYYSSHKQISPTMENNSVNHNNNSFYHSKRSVDSTDEDNKDYVEGICIGIDAVDINFDNVQNNNCKGSTSKSSISSRNLLRDSTKSNNRASLDNTSINSYDGTSTSLDLSKYKSGIWNCDGEAIKIHSTHCKVNRQLISLFSRGIPNSDCKMKP